MTTSARLGVAVSSLILLALTGTPGCVQDSAEPGPPSGPSELGLSLTLTASPDVLPLDGASQSLIGILARDAHGSLVSDLRLLLQIATEGGFVDFGQLSAREVMTGSDGRAAATYTVPLQATNAGAAPDIGQVVTILVTPIGNDFGNAVARALTIRLIPSGGVIPPFGATAGFGFTPAAPAAFAEVLFTTACPDATTPNCVRDPLGLVSSYLWSFGDGSAATGPTVSHSYSQAGTFVVTLTIQDPYGRSTQATRSVVIAGGTPPTAVIGASPTDPNINDVVRFNAAGSTAAPGRTIVSYAWDFGNGSIATGVTASTVFTYEGTFVVTLTVTDDKGQRGTTTAGLTVTARGPTADFVVSPTAPTAGVTVFFDAQSSDPGPGRDIIEYRWNFGDGVSVVGGPTVSHVFAGAGTYVVQLTITNDAGETDSVDLEVTVS